MVQRNKTSHKIPTMVKHNKTPHKIPPINNSNINLKNYRITI
jgi:hypothetical protein